MKNTAQLALALALLLTAACGDDGNNDQADARVGGNIDAASSIDAPGTPDADTSSADADTSTPDADTSTPDADPNAPDAMPSEIVINEFVLDQDGADTGEFVELKGMPSTSYSTYTILEIDGDAGGEPGEILNAIAAGTTDANGYWVTSVSANTFQNGSQTLLLVLNYNAGGGTDIDTNNDGVIDVEPWDALVDSVGILDGRTAGGETDRAYSGNSVLNKTFTSNDPVTFGGASRIPDGTDTDQAADWVSNTPDIGNAGIASGEARNTPGAVNSVEP